MCISISAISAVLFCVNKIKHKNEVLLSIKNSLIKEAVFHGSILKFSSISETTLNWQAEYGDNACFDGQYCVECIEEPIFNFDAVFSLNNLKNSIEYLSNLYKTGNIQDQNLKCVQNPFTSEIFSIFELKIDSIKKKSLLTVTCDFCSKEIVHSKMREHIASHIIVFKDISATQNTCGFCGNVGCTISLEKTSGFGVHSTFGPKSDCKLFYSFSLASAIKISTYACCTNRPIKCELCNSVYWSYNMQKHYESKHNQCEIPEFISSDEIKNLKKKYLK